MGPNICYFQGSLSRSGDHIRPSPLEQHLHAPRIHPPSSALHRLASRRVRRCENVERGDRSLLSHSDRARARKRFDSSRDSDVSCSLVACFLARWLRLRRLRVARIDVEELAAIRPKKSCAHIAWSRLRAESRCPRAARVLVCRNCNSFGDSLLAQTTRIDCWRELPVPVAATDSRSRIDSLLSCAWPAKQLLIFVSRAPHARNNVSRSLFFSTSARRVSCVGIHSEIPHEREQPTRAEQRPPSSRGPPRRPHRCAISVTNLSYWDAT